MAVHWCHAAEPFSAITENSTGYQVPLTPTSNLNDEAVISPKEGVKGDSESVETVF